MHNQELKSVIDKVSPIEPEAWEEFEQFFSERRLDKNEFLWKEGSVCKHLVFIKNGLIRSYSVRNSQEATWNFYFERSLFYDDYSFISQKPGQNNYQALEKTELILIPRAALYMMYDKYKSFERLGRISVELNHLKLFENQQRITSASAEENYIYLIEHFPEVVSRVPLKFIASYLNISPEHLSRIRKLITKT